ncbi:MAG: tRNA(Ile)-lysidine synthetase, partial [Verrucomicrobia bacterium]|nr:tRNA(Ile)-lysidine synthetase [Verrucomicrobiota bacterium]
MPAPTPSRDRWREAAAFFPANREQRCLVGVSGGRDSVALLHLLLEHGYHRLIVCHLDHGLREESAEDARFVAALARQHDLAFETTRTDVAALARASKQSLEAAGRAARHAFFATVAHRNRCWTLL